MKSVKLASTKALGRLRGEAGELWQPRLFDHALRTVQDYWEKVEYIHLNPVRRGLVARPEDWTWSSAAEYSGASPEEQRRRCGLVITGYDYQRRARPASDLRRLDARAKLTSRRPKRGVCATLTPSLCWVRFPMKPSTLRFGAPKQAGKSRGTLRRRYTERVR